MLLQFATSFGSSRPSSRCDALFESSYEVAHTGAAKATLTVLEAKPLGLYGINIDVGSKVEISFGENAEKVRVYFLGRWIRHDGEKRLAFYLSGESPQVLLYFERDFGRIEFADGTVIQSAELRPQPMNLAQGDPLCAGIACLTALRAIDELKVPNLNQLNHELRDGNARSERLLSIIFQLFIQKRQSPEIQDFDQFLRSELGRLGLKKGVYHVGQNWNDTTKHNLIEEVKRGWPVILGFDTDRTRNDAAFEVLQFGTATKLFNRFKPSFYYPSTRTVRAVEQHTVVLTSYVELEGRGYFIVADPNNWVPQIWPVSVLDNAYAARFTAWVVSKK